MGLAKTEVWVDECNTRSRRRARGEGLTERIDAPGQVLEAIKKDSSYVMVKVCRDSVCL